VLVTCNTDNIASAQVIQKNGGKLAGEVISNKSGSAVSHYDRPMMNYFLVSLNTAFFTGICLTKLRKIFPFTKFAETDVEEDPRNEENCNHWFCGAGKSTVCDRTVASS